MPKPDQAEAATSFGDDYRLLARNAPVGGPDTTTRVSIPGFAAVNTNFIVDPFTTSSATGSPLTSTPLGYGWRTVEAFNEIVPAGKWNFTITTETLLATGSARARVFAYSTDPLGSDPVAIGSATGSTNVLALLGAQTQTISFTTVSDTDLRGRVLVVEYWIEVTSSPVLVVTVIFQADSSTQTVSIPTSPSTTLYLDSPRLHSLDESLSATDSTARLYQASRPATETVQVSEGIAFHVTRPASDTLTVSDQITPNTSRPLAESIAVSDDPATNMSPPAADSATIADSIARTYLAARQPTDSLAVSESISFAVTRSVGETLAVSDGFAGKVTGRALSDSIGLSEGILPASARPAPESIAVTDAVAMSVTRSLQESITVSDAPQRAYSASRGMSETATLADAASKSEHRGISDSITLADSAAPAGMFVRQAGDSVALLEQPASGLGALRAVADSASVGDSAGKQASSSRAVSETATISESLSGAGLAARSITEFLSVADSPGRAHATSVQLADAITLADSTVQQPGLAEQLAVSDSISIAFPRSISDSIAVQDAISGVRGGSASDSVQVADQITSVTVSWNRGFEESLALGDCTPFSCNQALHIEEGVALADEFSPPPGPEEALSVSDSIAVTRPRGAGDTLAITSSASTIVRPLPASPPAGSPLAALGALVVSDAALAEPLSAEPVAGQYSMPDRNPDALVDELGLPALELAGVSDLSSAAVVLPTYHVTLSPSDELPGDDALLTVRVAEIPAETQIIVPVDIASTPAAAEHDNIPSMTLDFTPAVDASDFALVVSIIDSPPAGMQEPEGNLVPLYLDVRWVGTFGGGVDPSEESFYSEPPEFTFALDDEWADSQNIERDGNGVPVITLNLLDESTGEWEEIDDIDVPIAANEDGRFVYVAHLEHFSTYALAAASADSGSGGGSRSSSSRLSVQLVDSLAIGEEQAQAVVEEPASQQFAVQLLDNVSISSTPVAYWPIEAGDDMSVLVTVADIRPAGIFPPTASVLLAADVTNKGAQVQTLALEFWHGTGRSSAAVAVGPGESRQVFAEVPFTAPGEQALTAETRTAAGELISSRQISIDVPWLAVYMHLVTTLLGVLATVAGAGFYLFVRQKFT